MNQPRLMKKQHKTHYHTTTKIETTNKSDRTRTKHNTNKQKDKQKNENVNLRIGVQKDKKYMLRNKCNWISNNYWLFKFFLFFFLLLFLQVIQENNGPLESVGRSTQEILLKFQLSSSEPRTNMDKNHKAEMFTFFTCVNICLY